MADKDTPQRQEAPRQAGGDAGEAEVQKAMDEETEQGFRGTKVDPLENEAYTVKGVTSSDKAARQDRRLPQES